MDIPKSRILFFIDDGNDPAAQAAIDKLIADFNDHPALPRAISNIEEGYCNKIFAASSSLSEDYFRSAVKVWEKVMGKFPDFFHNDPDLYYFIAYCYRHLGEYEKAIQHYSIVVDNWPDCKHAWHAQFMVARCYEKLEMSGRILTVDAAVKIRQACEKLLANYPNSKVVMAARNLLKRWDVSEK